MTTTLRMIALLGASVGLLAACGGGGGGGGGAPAPAPTGNFENEDGDPDEILTLQAPGGSTIADGAASRLNRYSALTDAQLAAITTAVSAPGTQGQGGYKGGDTGLEAMIRSAPDIRSIRGENNVPVGNSYENRVTGANVDGTTTQFVVFVPGTYADANSDGIFEPTREDALAGFLRVDGNIVAFTSGAPLSSAPTGTHKYDGRSYALQKSETGLAATAAGDFTMTVDWDTSRISVFSAEVTSPSGQDGEVKGNDMPFSRTTGKFTAPVTFEGDYFDFVDEDTGGARNGDAVGNFHAEGGLGVSGTFQDDNNEVGGTFAGTRGN